MNIYTAVILYILAINIIAFIMYGYDKHNACHNQWRIPESTLLVTAAIGGSIGAWCGMKAWHHKTMHLKFKYGIPFILVVQVIITIYLITNH